MKFKTKLRKNDDVIVIAGSDKGKRGKILNIHPSSNRVTVKGVNIVTKHNKPSQQKQQGSIETYEAPIAISNVAFALNKGKNANNQYTKLASQFKSGSNNKVRIAKKNKKVV